MQSDRGIVVTRDYRVSYHLIVAGIGDYLVNVRAELGERYNFRRDKHIDACIRKRGPGQIERGPRQYEIPDFVVPYQ